MGKINIVIICTLLGALINIILNILLIPSYGHNGTAIAFMLTEVTVTIIMFFLARNIFQLY